MSEQEFIPLSVPEICGNEWTYVKECLDTGWISSVGSFVDKFEKMVADYAGAEFGVAAVNGTAVLHCALMLAGVERDDFVIMPNITFVASANAISYCGAEPILVDADPEDWQMDLDLLEQFLDEATQLDSQTGDCIHKESGRRIKAIMPVHVQGNIGDMDRLLAIAQKHKLAVVEDAAEAIGSTYKSRHAGTMGLIGCLSFNGNKMISTGGGGVLLTNDEALAKKAKHLTTTAKTDPLEYYHDQVGYNYRLVNVLAAIGVAQMEKLDEFVQKKRNIGEYYKNELHNVGDIRFQSVSDDVHHNNWLFTIQSSKQKEILDKLNSNRVISRPFWAPMTKLPMYKDCLYVSESDRCDHIHRTCLAVPCSVGISNENLERVVKLIKEVF